MNKTSPIIVGAGLAGLLAAHAWPQAQIFERSPEPRAGHRALLRFRSDAVSRLTGIEFRPVLVRKGIWCRGGFHSPRIDLANMYAMKVIGALTGERSIWNIDPVTRYVAPDTFYEQLISAVSGRVTWGAAIGHRVAGAEPPLISTAPLPETAAEFGVTHALPFDRAPITVRRILLAPETDVYQTIYFPDPELSMYRASITGRTLIVEFAGDGPPSIDNEEWKTEIERAFGLPFTPLGAIETVHQKYGKINPVSPEDDAARKHLLFRLTHEHNVYSLGRFATWRNLLLDDVVDDIAMIKRLMRSNAPAYDLRRADSAAG